MTATLSFSGTLLVEDSRAGLSAYLTDAKRIAVVDSSGMYDYRSFDEFAEDCGDEPRFVKAVAKSLNTKPPADHDGADAQDSRVGGDPTLTASQACTDTHRMGAGGGTPTPEYVDGRLVLVSRELAVLAERVHALEEFRKACANQHQALTDTKIHKDGEYRGQHLPADHPVAAQSAAIVDSIKKIEDELVKSLEKELKRSLLGPWIKAQKGLGAKTIARLLASTGDPYWNDLHDRPRTVSELWAFCGYRPGLKKAKGQQMNWSPDAKMRAHVVVEPIIKMISKPCYSVKGDDNEYLYAVHIDGQCTCSPYRVMWDEARDKYRDSIHPEDCVRCGPSGNPAKAGSIRSAKHQMAMANRLVKKRILQNLWREAKRIHEEP